MGFKTIDNHENKDLPFHGVTVRLVFFDLSKEDIAVISRVGKSNKMQLCMFWRFRQKFHKEKPQSLYYLRNMNQVRNSSWSAEPPKHEGTMLL